MQRESDRHSILLDDCSTTTTATILMAQHNCSVWFSCAQLFVMCYVKMIKSVIIHVMFVENCRKDKKQSFNTILLLDSSS